MTMLTMTSGESLFASPLVTFMVPDAAALNAQLLAEIAAMRAHSQGLQRSNQNGWHSPLDFFRRLEPGCAALCDLIAQATRQATTLIAPEFVFAEHQAQLEGWVNVNGRGAFNAPHNHPAWAWSGAYYVRTEHTEDDASALPADAGQRRSGCIEFLDPRTNVRAFTVEGAPCFMSKYCIRPRDGMLMLFPAWLQHWVYPNEGNFERVSVAFNARFLPVARNR